MNDEVMKRLIDTLMELQKKESTDLPLLKKQLAETEKGINNMLNSIQAGIFTPSTKQRLDELEKTKSQLEVSILQEEMHKLILTFNYKDGSKTITLAEVEGSDLSVLGAPRRSKVRFAPTFFYSCGIKEHHPPASLRLLSNCDPLCWARSWWAALRTAFLFLTEISVLTAPCR